MSEWIAAGSAAEDEMFSDVAEQILSGVERTEGGGWRMPWHVLTGGWPRNAFNGRRFKGMNVFALWSAAKKYGFTCHQWASETAWKNRGGLLKVGQEGTTISIPYFDEDTPSTRWKRSTPGVRKKVGPLGRDAQGGELRRPKGYYKAEWYNADQVDGITVTDPVLPTPHEGAALVIEGFHVWRRINYGPAFLSGGSAAYYQPDVDRIQMPAEQAFYDHPDSSGRVFYAQTLVHECGHASGSPGRLNRERGKRFGDPKYAREELIAEFASAFVCAHYGLPSVMMPHHAKYVSSWLEAFTDKKKLPTLLWAIAQAEVAAQYLIQRMVPPEPGAAPLPMAPTAAVAEEEEPVPAVVVLAPVDGARAGSMVA